MRRFFAPNIGTLGRLIRAAAGVALLVAAWFGLEYARWLGTTLLVSGVFVIFEATRGWCIVRACGIRTRL